MLGGEGLKTVWIETLPVLSVREEDDGDACVSEVPDSAGSLLVRRDIPLLEVHMQRIKGLLRESAWAAGGRRKNSDQ